jgi:hypothetical protein
MRNFIFTFIILSTPFFSFSQTKIATEEWIKGKFNKWKIADVRSLENSMSGHSEKPTSLSFNNCYLILKTKFTYFSSPSSPDYRTYKLNIGDVEEYKWIKYKHTNYFVIITSKSQVQLTTGSENSYIDRCVIAFNVDGEDDFEQRMLKAFNHLKRFCKPTIKAKETF